MSRTVAKGIALGLFCLTCTPVLAQETAADLLSSFKASAPGTKDDTRPNVSKDKIISAIESHISKIAEGSQSDAGAPGSGAMTVEDIDRTNRENAAATGDLELQKIRLDKMKTELDALLYLHAAMEQLDAQEGKKTATDPVTAAEAQALAAQQAQPPQRQKKTDADIEEENLPSVFAIYGAKGSNTAIAKLADGTDIQFRAGDYIQGFEVVDVTPQFAVVKGDETSKKYRLSPRAPAARPAKETVDPNQTIDVSQFPITMF